VDIKTYNGGTQGLGILDCCRQVRTLAGGLDAGRGVCNELLVSAKACVVSCYAAAQVGAGNACLRTTCDRKVFFSIELMEHFEECELGICAEAKKKTLERATRASVKRIFRGKESGRGGKRRGKGRTK
jgi:hypothetical protein